MKGSAYAWIVVLIMIFAGSFLWIIFSQVLVVNVFPDTIEMMEDANQTQSVEVAENIQNVWDYWPLILIGGLIIYGVVSSLKKEPDTYYGWG